MNGNVCEYEAPSTLTVASGGVLSAVDSIAPTTGSAGFACQNGGINTTPNAGATCDTTPNNGGGDNTTPTPVNPTPPKDNPTPTPTPPGDNSSPKLCPDGHPEKLFWSGDWIINGYHGDNTQDYNSGPEPGDSCSKEGETITSYRVTPVSFCREGGENNNDESCPKYVANLTCKKSCNTPSQPRPKTCSGNSSETRWENTNALCPTGQTGNITYEREQRRTRLCDTATGAWKPWSGWQDTGNKRNERNGCKNNDFKMLCWMRKEATPLYRVMAIEPADPRPGMGCSNEGETVNMEFIDSINNRGGTPTGDLWMMKGTLICSKDGCYQGIGGDLNCGRNPRTPCD